MEKEMVYVVFLNSEVLAFCFDIDIFFNYLRSFLSRNPDVRVEILRQTTKDCKIFYQSLYSMEEIIEFTKNVYLTCKEACYWQNYFEEFRYETIKMVKRKNEKSIHLDLELRDLDSFLRYLGSDMVSKIVSGFDFNEMNTIYTMYAEYLRKIEDK